MLFIGGETEAQSREVPSLGPHTSQWPIEETRPWGPGLHLQPMFFSPPSLSLLGLFCSPDQGRLCLGIVFPEKFPLWCHRMTQSPESPGGRGPGGRRETRERTRKGAPSSSPGFPTADPPGLTSPLTCLASVSPNVKGDAGL